MSDQRQDPTQNQPPVSHVPFHHAAATQLNWWLIPSPPSPTQTEKIKPKVHTMCKTILVMSKCGCESDSRVPHTFHSPCPASSLALLQTTRSLHPVSTHLASSHLHQASIHRGDSWPPPIMMTCKYKPKLPLLSQWCTWGLPTPISPSTWKHYFSSLQLHRHTYDMGFGGKKTIHQIRKTKKREWKREWKYSGISKMWCTTGKHSLWGNSA